MARRKQRKSSTGEDDVNLTPMLDVTFILLIFFIVTAQFIKEPGIEPTRPDVDNDDRVSPLGILIGIDESSDIYINKSEVPPEEVAFRIRELREDNPKGEIVIQVDEEARAGTMESVITSVIDADPAATINISTEQE